MYKLTTTLYYASCKLQLATAISMDNQSNYYLQKDVEVFPARFVVW